MANTEKLIEGLQVIVTNLAQQADGHAIQSRIFLQAMASQSWLTSTLNTQRKSADMLSSVQTEYRNV